MAHETVEKEISGTATWECVECGGMTNVKWANTRTVPIPKGWVEIEAYCWLKEAHGEEEDPMIVEYSFSYPRPYACSEGCARKFLAGLLREWADEIFADPKPEEAK